MSDYKIRIQGAVIATSKERLTGQDILDLANLHPAEDYELLIKVNEKGFEPVQLDEEIDLRNPGIEGFSAKPYKKLEITVDDQLLEIEDCFITPDELLVLAGKEPENFFLNQKTENREIGYQNDPNHKIGIRNGQRFYSFKRVFTIYVNATPEKWEKKTITFEEVVKLAFPKAPYGANTEFQVLYSDAQGGKDGRLVVGQSVKVKNGTKFDVTATDKS